MNTVLNINDSGMRSTDVIFDSTDPSVVSVTHMANSSFSSSKASASATSIRRSSSGSAKSASFLKRKMTGFANFIGSFISFMNNHWTQFGSLFMNFFSGFLSILGTNAIKSYSASF